MSNRPLRFRVLLSTLVVLACRERPEPPVASPQDPAFAVVGSAAGRFVGSAACRECHADEHRSWADGAHALALRPVGPGAQPRVTGATLGDGFSVGADGSVVGPGANGAPVRGRAAYVVGGRRREDLWVRMDDGRLQVFPWSWDVTRRQAFEPYRELTGRTAPGDALDHWTRLGRNADLICYGCHATGHRLAFGSVDPATASPSSSWLEAGVGCEGCHGPSGPHVDAARAGDASRAKPPNDAKGSCDGCHALREPLASPFGAEPAHRYGAPLSSFADRLPRVPADFEHRRATFADLRPATFGQQSAALEQSGCARRGGLDCATCHDPHGGGLTASASGPEGGDAVCAPCHAAIAADAAAHSGHARGTPGARCFSCHLAPIVTGPARDRVRDHSLAPPTAPPGSVPAACAACHAGTADAAAIAAAWGRRTLRSASARRRLVLGDATAAAERGDPGALPALARVAADAGESRTVRALAAATLAGLADFGASAQGLSAAAPLLDADDPSLRRAGARLVARARPDGAPPPSTDPWLALEWNAAASLAGADAATVRLSELTRHPELTNEARTHVALGLVAIRARDWPRAESSFRRALASNPFFLPAWNGLGIALRSAGREADARAAFGRALEMNPQYLPARRNLEETGAVSGVPPAR